MTITTTSTKILFGERQDLVRYSTPSIPPSTASIGARMRQLRQQAGLSQASLARRVGLSPPAISAWEGGRAGSSRKHLPAIAQALSVSIASLLTRPDQSDILPPDVQVQSLAASDGGELTPPLSKPLTSSPSRDIGARIRLLRQVVGMSKSDLAHNVGISISAIAFWETGRPGNAQKHLPKIAEALGVDVEALLDGNCHAKAPIQLSGDEQLIVQFYRRLDTVGKIKVQRWLEKQANGQTNSRLPT